MALCTSDGSEDPMGTLANLHIHELLHVFSFLHGEDLAKLACCSKALLSLVTEHPSVWRALQDRDFPAVARILAAESSASARLPAVPPDEPPQALAASCGLAAYRRGRDLSRLSSVRWGQIHLEPSRLAASPREGSASAVLAGAGLVIGGWTTFGIQDDVRALRMDSNGRPTWVPARASGRPMGARYGHTATTCGDKVVVFGGMLGGGYRGEIGHVAVLSPVSAPAPDSAVASPSGGAGTSTVGAVDKGASSSAGGSGNSPSGGGSSGGRGGERGPAGGRNGTNAGDSGASDTPGLDFQWTHPRPCEHEPLPRGYHFAASSECGRFLYVFGGINEGDAISSLAVLDTETWQWSQPAATGDAPGPRFGGTAVCFRGKLFLFGGGTGGDLLREGEDLHDGYSLDLSSWEWRRIPPPEPPMQVRLGKCHSGVLVGTKWLLFGGTMRMSNTVSWIDLATETWGKPAATGAGAPVPRFTQLLFLLGSRVVLFGGWTNGGPGVHRGCLGDVWSLDLGVSGPQMAEPGGAQGASSERTWSRGAMGGSLSEVMLRAFAFAMQGRQNDAEALAEGWMFNDDDDDEDEDDEDDDEYMDASGDEENDEDEENEDDDDEEEEEGEAGDGEEAAMEVDGGEAAAAGRREENSGGRGRRATVRPAAGGRAGAEAAEEDEEEEDDEEDEEEL